MRSNVAKGKRSRWRGFVSAYLVTCEVNNKKYVGICLTTPKARWVAHCRSAVNGSQAWLHAAIRKYGPEAFEVTEIACARNWNDACATEAALISQIGTFGTGNYNMTSGGDGGPVVCRDDNALRQRQERASILGRRPRSQETMAKMKEGIRRSWTPERRAATSNQAIQRMADPAYKANLMASHSTPQYRDMISKKRKGTPLSARTKALLSSRRAGRKQSPETIAKRVAALRAFYAAKRNEAQPAGV